MQKQHHGDIAHLKPLWTYQTILSSQSLVIHLLQSSRYPQKHILVAPKNIFVFLGLWDLALICALLLFVLC